MYEVDYLPGEGWIVHRDGEWDMSRDGFDCYADAADERDVLNAEVEA